ncbi:MAG: glutamate--tRNA ligase, partial [Eubacteriales bacterium]|nr:glutamate--tRNA ligase [Eubacteriales bacterium]
SKRDKGSGLKSYIKEGYPAESVIEYVLGLLNSNFEDWRRANPDLPYNDFPFSIKKMSASGALFDLVKLNDVSRNVISRFTAEKVFEKLLDWTKSYDKEFYKLLSADKNYAESILSIGRGGAKARKDFALWSELRPYMSFFYDELFERQDKIEGFNENDVKAVTSDFVNNYNPDDDQNEWFAKVKQIAADNGFCPDMKQYKQNPEDFKGSVADVSMFLRVAVTGRQNSPDLWSVMQILGKDRVVSRLTSYNI